MTLIIILIVFVLSLALCLVETFLIPGFGICGIISALCAIIGVSMAFSAYGMAVGFAAAAAVLIVGGLLLYWVMHSKRIKRLSLHATIDSSVANDVLSQVKVGDSGVALTRLALVGNARLGEVETEVRSASGFIEEGTPVRVVRINRGEIYVSANPNNI
ncbi:MAG: nodulation protein NfeD [Prevotellaceae bacterium]|nr:nodulation protein NfeD [Prevotellaceae bacterium]